MIGTSPHKLKLAVMALSMEIMLNGAEFRKDNEEELLEYFGVANLE